MSDKAIGKTTIAPEVLHTIARLTTLSVPGVSRMAPLLNPFDRMITKSEGEGVEIAVKEDTVSADVFVVLNDDVNVREVSRNIQKKVSRAISELVGMDVSYVNIHIVDIDYSA